MVYVDSQLGILAQRDLSGHFVGFLNYSEDVTLVVPSLSGVCTLYYEINFNRSKIQF